MIDLQAQSVSAPSMLNRELSLSYAQLQAIMSEVERLPVRWFEAGVQTAEDPNGFGTRTYVYLRQTSGPRFITGLTIGKTEDGFVVTIQRDDGRDLIEDWDAVDTIAEAVQSIGDLLKRELASWGVKAINGRAKGRRASGSRD